NASLVVKVEMEEEKKVGKYPRRDLIRAVLTLAIAVVWKHVQPVCRRDVIITAAHTGQRPAPRLTSQGSLLARAWLCALVPGACHARRQRRASRHALVARSPYRGNGLLRSEQHPRARQV